MTIEANFYIFLFESFSVLARREQVHQTGSKSRTFPAYSFCSCSWFSSLSQARILGPPLATRHAVGHHESERKVFLIFGPS